MGLAESKLSIQLENAVVKKDTRSLKKLLKTERYDVKYLEGALVKAAEANNLNAVQLLLDHVKPSEIWRLNNELTNALCVVFSAAAKVGRDKLMRFAVDNYKVER